MPSPFTLAHLSDVHLGPLPPLSPRYWNAKRALGYLNWHKSRKHVHLAETRERLLADLLAQRPDHIAVTGDLVNIGLPAEYIAAERFLERLGSPENVTVVPGNHDIYTRLRDNSGYRRWAPYMLATGTAKPNGELEFPFVRRLGPLVLVGVNSAVPTRPLYAGGRVGPEQLQRLATALEHLRTEKLARVILIHHPPVPGQAAPSKALSDAAALEAVLARAGAELVLHGHNHRAMYSMHPGDRGALPIIGVPSASLGRPRHGEDLARYHLFRFAADGNGPRIEMKARGFVTPDGPIVELEHRVL